MNWFKFNLVTITLIFDKYHELCLNHFFSISKATVTRKNFCDHISPKKKTRLGRIWMKCGAKLEWIFAENRSSVSLARDSKSMWMRPLITSSHHGPSTESENSIYVWSLFYVFGWKSFLPPPPSQSGKHGKTKRRWEELKKIISFDDLIIRNNL